MRTSSTTVSLASQRPDRELLADAAPITPGDSAVFLRMFERRSAVTLWDKIIHTLSLPWRRHWARQQVASVLSFAQYNPATASLPAIKALQGEFDKGGRIREQTARNATIEMMLAGALPASAVPASAWPATLNSYLDTMRIRCAAIINQQYLENTRDLAPDSETKSRWDAEYQKQSEGLTVFMKFIRSAPADQLSMADYSAVWAFRKAVIGPYWSAHNAEDVQMRAGIDMIWKRYCEALANPHRVTERLPIRLTVPTIEKCLSEIARIEPSASTTATSLQPDPELIEAFERYRDRNDKGKIVHDVAGDDQRKTEELLATCSADYLNNQELELRHLAIAVAEVLADPKKLTDLKVRNQSHLCYLLLIELEHKQVSPACREALAMYMTCQDESSKAALPVSTWLCLIHLFEHELSFPKNPSTPALAQLQIFLTKLREDIERFIAVSAKPTAASGMPHYPGKSSAQLSPSAPASQSPDPAASSHGARS